MFTGPKKFSAAATMRSQPAALVTSRSRKCAFGPSSLASAEPVSARMSVSTTLAPSAINIRACDAPMPRDAPVTIAVLPSSLPISASPIIVSGMKTLAFVWCGR
jgi:hypothetical protein